MDIPNLIGRYEIIERIARGGMGALYHAHDPVLDRQVAIKVMLADFSHDAVGRARFYREARAVARLQHRNIVTLFDFGEDEGSPYIVMEYLQGESLAKRLKSGPPLPLDQALSIGAQLCTGLHFAHQHGVVHRDVKPANIWLQDEGSVKLLDFGIAKYGDTDVTRAGDVLGSVSYMSPEQLSGTPIDGRCDIFSAGIVLYELLTGRRPFPGESPTAIMMQIIHEEPTPLDAVPGAPPRLRTLVARALEKSPDQRFQHAAEFASELRELQTIVERQREAPAGRAADRHAETVPQARSVSAAADGTASRPVTATPPPAPRTPRQATVTAPQPPSSNQGTVEEAVVAPYVAAPTQPELQGGEQAAGRASRIESARTRGDHADHVEHAERADTFAIRPRETPVTLESDDPIGDMLIGGASYADRGSAAAHQPPPSSASRRSWVPAGAAAGAIVVAIVTFLLVRGESTEVIGGATANDDAASSAPPMTPSDERAATRPRDGAPGRGETAATGTRSRDDATAEPPGARDDRSSSSRAPSDPPRSEGRDEAGTRSPAPPSSGTGTASPTTFRVMLSGSYPFEVSNESGVLSRARSRHELTLPGGTQSLRLRAAEYALDRRIRVEGKPGAAVRVSAPALGRLTVRTPFETCRVILGGYPLGYPPIAERPVAAGTYRLQLLCPDGDNQSESVTIAPGETHVALIR